VTDAAVGLHGGVGGLPMTLGFLLCHGQWFKSRHLRLTINFLLRRFLLAF
jgi:hypothetical protein